MSTETTKKKIKIDNGTEFARVYTDKEVDSKLSGLSSDTAVIILSDAQVQSLANMNITFTQEQATLLEKSSSFKFMYGGTEIAHGQCGKITINSNTLYGISMILSTGIYIGVNESNYVLNNYTDPILLVNIGEIKVVRSNNVQVQENYLSIGYSELLGDGTASVFYECYFDKINNQPIIHTHSIDVKNYDLGKSINLFGKHSILVPNSSADTEINLYNHFIKITGTKDTTQIRARFTIQSSNNLVVDTPEKLTTLLGNEFELGCNGIYGNYSIIGLKKTADGTLNIIYNNGGAESLQSVAGLTISISDKVKTV